MRNFSKSPRAMHKDRLFEERAGLRSDMAAAEELGERKVESLRSDVKSFFEQVFGFTPYRYQMELAEMFLAELPALESKSVILQDSVLVTGLILTGKKECR